MVYSNILGQIRVGVRSGVVVPTITPLLDLYPGAVPILVFAFNLINQLISYLLNKK